MAAKPRRPAVYSTEKGRLCPTCGWPAASCRCSTELEQPIPDKIVARLRIERAGRRGKTVTVIEGLPRNTSFLREITTELKRACATGGTVVDDRIEVQGDHRERIRVLLASKEWTVKG
jgi:translation initiation factor 1